MSTLSVTSHRMEVPRSARYWMLEPEGVATKGTLYVLHGYGQLAQYFIRKFQAVADHGWRIVAPEGAHRFYLEGYSGRVGASWMTKEDRLADIADYLRFLDLLRKGRETTDGSLPHVLLGFSQGVATAFRWMAMGEGGPGSWHGIVAHSGIIPPDLPQDEGLLEDAPALHLIGGLEDAFITSLEDGFSTSEQEWQRCGGQPHQTLRLTFNGGHDIHAASVIQALGHIG